MQIYNGFTGRQLRSSTVLSLVFSWCSGLFLGCVVFCSVDSELFSWMRMACYRHVSIVGLIAVAVFPLLILSLSYFTSTPRLVFVFVFIKSFLFLICSAMFLSAFRSGGWLVRTLLMFTDSATVFGAIWLYIRRYTGIDRGWKDFVLYILCLMMVVCIDYLAISPYLACLLNEF